MIDSFFSYSNLKHIIKQMVLLINSVKIALDQKIDPPNWLPDKWMGEIEM